MKKHLIAAAVTAAIAAPAMAQNVSLGGVLDFAYGQIQQDGRASESTVSTRDLTSATSVINIIAVEDLGGGMKVTAKYGIDPRLTANDSGAPARDETFVGIEGQFGNIRLGSPNSIGLTTFLTAAPLGTGVGSGYSTTVMDYSSIRYNRSVRYDSPSINGFTFSYLHAPGSDQVVNAIPSGTIIPAAATQANEVGVRYAAGPLAVALANVSLSNFQGNDSASTSILAAQYTMGATTFSVGANDGEFAGSTSARAATSLKTKGTRVGIAHNIGAISLRANYVQQRTPTVKETVSGARVDYNLSKRSATYLAYELYNNGTGTNENRTITSVGLRHSF